MNIVFSKLLWRFLQLSLAALVFWQLTEFAGFKAASLFALGWISGALFGYMVGRAEE